MTTAINQDLQREIEAVKARLAAVEDAAHARTDAERFVANHESDYLQTRKNASLMADALQERGLPFTLENFETVFQEIKDQLEQPEPELEPTPTSQPAKSGKLTSEEQAWLLEIERLSASEYQKRLLNERGFAEKYERLSAKMGK